MTQHPGQRSIYDFLRAQIGDGVDLEDVELPDEEHVAGRVKFAAGAWDGVISHHAGSGETVVDELFAAVEAASTGRWRARRRFERLYERAKDPDLLGAIDPLLGRIRASSIGCWRLHPVAMRLATESAHRGPVKLGIALLGLFPADLHREVLLTLGRHDEFTLYAAVALGNGQDDPAEDLWRLAQQVHGWGRINLVERLAETERRDILDWILRDGFRNTVMDEYLAYLAASRGDLLSALSGDDVDDDLIRAAGDLLMALLRGGPASDIHDYTDGAAVVRVYLNLMREHATRLQHLLIIGAIRDFVTGDQPRRGWPDGWDEATRAAFTAQCQQLVAAPMWAPMAVEALEASDETNSWLGQRACTILGISTLPTLLRQLRQQPLDPTKWFHAVEQADQDTIHQVVDLAIEALPLEQIATGPGEELGLGQQWAAHQCLDFLIQGLDKWPGTGWPLITTALASPVIRNRNLAVRALAAWPRSTWPADTESRLRQAVSVEPQHDVKERMIATLEGRPLD
ncbi:hypothetical protein HDA40_001872 [Hamadaea flava]|uniref:HEAT repeat domain-containing protein n=1 Tax=Hamadaea flava TaxID=1742688 RepID=A0ABV8LDL8_9ACTN|nr:hypothetical protein [Hamadaea flava]MCP2323365.1 hypothetical protein [Hamadaea flava]